MPLPNHDQPVIESMNVFELHSYYIRYFQLQYPRGKKKSLIAKKVVREDIEVNVECRWLLSHTLSCQFSNLKPSGSLDIAKTTCHLFFQVAV